MTDKNSTQQRKHAFEEHDDGCVDEENDVGLGFYPSSKPMEKESDSHDLSYSTPLPPKRSDFALLVRPEKETKRKRFRLFSY